MIIWTIPQKITQADRVTWTQTLADYNSTTDFLSCFIRGLSPGLDLSGVDNGAGWDFLMSEEDSNGLAPGKYQAQFVIFQGGASRKALGIAQFLVCPAFENLPSIDSRSADEIELELITTAIAKLVSGAVAEYRIGDRMMRYQDLSELTNRQQYLRNRVAAAKNRGSIGGKNIGIRFSD